ncbi:MAG: DNA-binding protein [Candidatus Eisenbacteria bacterium]|uniref:DNA-binding protein n=1 Tax=Eiseniibacteriota bacterium TaxID=2212470 RepID=A0A538U0I7_UNCEI|nr:MAG: DNA-binding protein [Candidatus Eisenbacteria bacterium]
MAKKIGVIGTVQVGQTLADGFLKHGYTVMRGSRDPGKLAEWKGGAGASASTGTFAETAAFGELVVLAVKGTAAESAIDLSGAQNLRGKTVIDTTNPRFVKAFSCVGSAFMVDPALPGGPPTMFICGNHAGAKDEVKSILKEFGWDISDMGASEGARAIEPLCILWCIPGMTGQGWSHALKLLRA